MYISGAIFSLTTYQNQTGASSFFFPLIYLFSALLIIFTPFMKFNSTKTPLVLPNRFLINLLSWIFVVSSFLGIFLSPTSVVEELQGVLFNELYGLELYNNMLDSVEGSGQNIQNLPMIIMNAMYTFAALLLFVNLTYEKRNKLLIGLICFCLFYGAIKYISIGERGGLVNRSLIVLVSYVCMKDYLSEKINKRVRKVGLIVGVILAIPFMALTASRFSDTDEGTKNSLYNYAGQGTIYFCQYGLDDNGIRYGDRTVSLFKRTIGIPNTPRNFIERRSKYPHLKINDEVFSTIVGDFAIDFGPFIAFLIFISISLILTQIVDKSRDRINFHYFILLHLCMCAIVQGVSLFQYSDAGNLTIVFYLLLFFYLRIVKGVYLPTKTY